MTRLPRSILPFLVCLIAFVPPAWAGFAGNDLFLPAVGRVSGAGGSEFYTTVWITNVSATDPVRTTIQFLRSGGPNFSPPTVNYVLDPGESRLFENITETVFASPGVLGALRFQSTGDILVASRIYNQGPGAPVKNTQGLFFGGVPASFALRPGDSALIQGVNQGDDFRYNFFAVETTGQPATMRMKIRDVHGTVVAQKDYALGAYQQMLAGVTDIQPGFTTSNATLEASVVDGAGQVIVAGSQTANQSQDGSGFEMAFRPIGTATTPFTLNGLSGNVTLTAGSNITITPSGNTLMISAAAGPGGSGVPSVNGITGPVTITGSGSVSVSTSSNTVAITGTGGGGLTSVTTDSTLTGNGTSTTPLGIRIPLFLTSATTSAVLAGDNTASSGVRGTSSGGYGVIGTTTSGQSGVRGEKSDKFGLLGTSSAGVFGSALGSTGVSGPAGVIGDSATGIGVLGASGSGPGVMGVTPAGTQGSLGTSSAGVLGLGGPNEGRLGATTAAGSPAGAGVWGTSGSGFGVAGYTTSGTGVFGSNGGSNTTGHAGFFSGRVTVTGTLNKPAGSFKIDHPLDPENKYLYHSFVESPDMMNIYNGNVVLDGRGEATIELPDWFSALNRDFRYQLTAVGAPSPNLYVADEIADNHFRIAGGSPGAKVSWQVTGIRHDRYADAHRIPVEEEKPADERGFYIHPDLYGQPPERAITPIRATAASQQQRR